MNAMKMELLERIYSIAVQNDSMNFIELDENFYKFGDLFNIQYLDEKELICVDAEEYHGVPTLVSLTVEAIDLVESRFEE